MSKKILAIETATEACSVALACGDKIHQRFEHQPQQQAQLVLPMVEAVLAEAGLKPAELDAIAFGCGPGSFTGLRIAASVTQGIAVAIGLPVIPVSTLAAIAQGVYRRHGDESVLAAIDARMQEVYWGCYRLQDGRMQLCGEEGVSPPGEVALPENTQGWAGAGSGWRAYPEALQQRLGDVISNRYPEFWPQAGHLLELAQSAYERGETVEVGQARPVYLRNNVAKPKAARE